MLWFDLFLVAASLIGCANHQDSYRLRWSSVCLGRLRDSQRLSTAGRPSWNCSTHSPFTQTYRFYFSRTYSLYLRHFAVTILYQAALREPSFRVEGSSLEPADFHLDWPHTALQTQSNALLSCHLRGIETAGLDGRGQAYLEECRRGFLSGRPEVLAVD